jgi:hypothetical protein
MVLMAEGHKFMLTQSCLDFPTIDAYHEDHQRYDHWQKSTEMEKCYILASVKCTLVLDLVYVTCFRHHDQSV